MKKVVSGKPNGLYIWHTVGDSDVRAAHAGTLRDFADSPAPGEEFNCRCWAELVPDEPGIEPVYPELLLIPLLRVGRLYSAWKLWLNRRDSEWSLGRHKSQTRWGNQLLKRNWSPDDITKTIRYGKRYRAPNKVNQGNTATRYEYNGRYLVRDDQTREILQLGDKSFKRPPIPPK